MSYCFIPLKCHSYFTSKFYLLKKAKFLWQISSNVHPISVQILFQIPNFNSIQILFKTIRPIFSWAYTPLQGVWLGNSQNIIIKLSYITNKVSVKTKHIILLIWIEYDTNCRHYCFWPIASGCHCFKRDLKRQQCLQTRETAIWIPGRRVTILWLSYSKEEQMSLSNPKSRPQLLVSHQSQK